MPLQLLCIFPVGTTFDTYYKYGPTPNNTTNHWYEFLYDGQTGAEISGNVITLHFVDGKRGDDDLTANGIIVDVGAPAVVCQKLPVEAPLLLLMVVEVAVVLLRLQRMVH